MVCREQYGGHLHLEWDPPLVDAETSLLYTVQIQEQGACQLAYKMRAHSSQAKTRKLVAGPLTMVLCFWFR